MYTDVEETGNSFLRDLLVVERWFALVRKLDIRNACLLRACFAVLKTSNDARAGLVSGHQEKLSVSGEVHRPQLLFFFKGDPGGTKDVLVVLLRPTDL